MTAALMLILIGVLIYGTIALVCWLDMRETRRSHQQTAERLDQIIADVEARAPYLKYVRGPHR